MPTVLITGGAGYLGSHVTAAFLGAGYKVTVLDNFRHGVPSLSHLSHAKNLTIVHGDARDMSVVGPLAGQADIIIPLAAVVGAPACDVDQQYAIEINTHAVTRMVAALSSQQTVIYPNTNSGYGIGGETLCTEETPLEPISWYGQTKKRAEEYVLSRGGTSLRFATLFGPSARMRLDLMVNDFVYRAVKDKSIVLYEGNFRRNFLHVQDAAALFPYMVDMVDAGSRVHGQAFNAGLSSANMTKHGLCDEIKKQVEDLHIIEVPLAQDPDKRDYIVSNAKLERTGWKPTHSLESGIAQLIRCYRQPFHDWAYRNY